MCLGSLQFSVLGGREKHVAHAGGGQGDIASLRHSCLTSKRLDPQSLLTGDSGGGGSAGKGSLVFLSFLRG